jgi:ABC-type nitrate/sulfonate/bicarbonate transport system substrate-binding protein
VRFRDLKDFHNHVIFGTNRIIAEKPDAVRAFLKGWFETIAFMRKNKTEAVTIAADVTKISEAIVSRTYDEVISMFSDTGKFDPRALVTLSKSFVELKVLPDEPDMSNLYTEAFLPK